MSKHTPGPWKVGDKIARFVYASDETPICECDSIGEARKDIELANARLISAAPEMFEALSAAIECNMVPVSTAKDGGAVRYARQVVVADMIRDAIAKATGAT